MKVFWEVLYDGGSVIYPALKMSWIEAMSKFECEHSIDAIGVREITNHKPKCECLCCGAELDERFWYDGKEYGVESGYYCDGCWDDTEDSVRAQMAYDEHYGIGAEERW